MLTLNEIKELVLQGKKIYWHNSKSYVVVDNNEFFVNVHNEELESLEELFNENQQAFYYLSVI